MNSLNELKTETEKHLKKSEDLLSVIDFLLEVSVQAQEAQTIPPAMADKAAFVASELRLNYQQHKIFLHDLNVLAEKPTDDALNVMIERFNRLKVHQLANFLCCDDLLNSYKPSQA